ncbi:fumarate reductase subunit C [Mycobacterium sp. CBMA293]|uniref:fumarate reductase subunit C n=1 Tax=unclassified Mycolicibacterium TaxID=2636767 RepID=UPI0012DF270A|nr:MULTISPECIES: fumarate reductase subunit C [unclassified Mycolicibacterium]MUL46373.1 fumarate reductase subunit C [Mycolicibacterium sp. CBMA 360]MUL57115.1 fumarate reductase subunit C [Mycolicibacterium sp. CBMA 335]MUL70155.1 fumarate reductase subunit C [Mycolicibacterium sp. CBMA 311]MUL92203.1 fumarate reductase subunit C [Mycolicibacterium sp. CBMA 230]MUM04861.1 fumarate reductase subunit C [Mycolicibacterium sp. CBMA 213]
MTTSARPYRPPVPRLWWTKRRSYRLFMLREISCVFVAWSVVYLVWLVRAIGRGGDAYREFLGTAAAPPLVALNIVTLLFLLLHAVSWFRLAPRAMVIHVRGQRLPARMVLAAHYLAWLVVTAVIAWVVLT